PDPAIASRVVMLDALVANVDRTAKNPNLLSWHGRAWLIDHGASLYFHHGWSAARPLEGARDPYVEVKQHVLLPFAAALADAERHVARAMTDDTFARVAAAIPASWLGDDEAWERAAYRDWLRARAAFLPALREEAERERA